MQIDVTVLTDEQLTALAIISPDAARQERLRRAMYPDLDTGFSALAQAVFELRQAIDNLRNTTAVRAVMSSNVLDVSEKLLAKAHSMGYSIASPTLKV